MRGEGGGEHYLISLFFASWFAFLLLIPFPRPAGFLFHLGWTLRISSLRFVAGVNEVWIMLESLVC